jgi:hypothetical protein
MVPTNQDAFVYHPDLHHGKEQYRNGTQIHPQRHRKRLGKASAALVFGSGEVDE